MASQSGDPARDPQAEYDYASDQVDRPELVDALETRVSGEVRFDRYSRGLYATDASIYEVMPVGVVFPQSTADVAAVMRYCAEHEIPVLPRGGGTSLAGQAVNEAVVLDFTRYMDAIIDISPEIAQATAEPGVVLGDLNAELEPVDLKFAPDPAWGDKSALGGAIGNNSTGAHSLKYGKTDAYIESCEVVLADGSVTTFGECSIEELNERADPDGDLEDRIYAEVARIVDEEADEIRAKYPDLKRNVSGYNLDWLISEAETGTVNLASLLCGSEGTLGIVTEATVSLEPIPDSKSMALFSYADLFDAMADVEAILAHEPAAVEVLDDVLLELAAETEEFGDLVEMLPTDTGAVLLVEFYADTDEAARSKVASVITDRLAEETDTSMSADQDSSHPPVANDAMEAHTAAERERFWKLRKSGLPILLSRTTDEKHIAFIEDTAIPTGNLEAFVRDVSDVLDEHDTYASFYAHAGPGVLHIRPLINTKTAGGRDQMASIADAVTDLVVKYDGSVSGEHGDGRARTQWNRKLYGDHLWSVFRQLKTTFDPDWLLNPGQVCGDVELTEELRFDESYDYQADLSPTLEWSNENGVQGMVELCHGCGGCRGSQETTGGVMCPTYRASREEITSTRGRANLLRDAMSGELAATDLEFLTEVMDLCIGCKGCARDCPSEVDMAKLKAEVTHAAHQRHGASYRDQAFANIDRLSAIGSAFAPVSNWLPKLPGARWLGERVFGLAADRQLPTFQRRTFSEWFDARDPSLSEPTSDRSVVLLPDTFTNFTAPTVGKAAVEVLESAGVAVTRAPCRDVGRPAFSKGFLDTARDRTQAAVDSLTDEIASGRDIVALEPSDAVMLQSDARDLLTGEAVDRVADRTFGFAEYLVETDCLQNSEFVEVNDRLTYHGHCHQKATKRANYAVTALRQAGYQVEALDSGCCGMAGSFGYEAEHYSMSKAIGRILIDQIDAAEGRVVAPGASCRSQIAEFLGKKPPHPAEVIAEALPNTAMDTR